MDPRHVKSHAFMLKMIGCPYEAWTALADEWFQNFLARDQDAALSQQEGSKAS